MWALIGLAVCVIYVVGLLYEKKRGGSKAPPKVHTWLPWIGNAISFSRDPVGWATQKWRENGEIFTVTLCGKRVTMLVGPNAHVPFFKCDDDVVGMFFFFFFFSLAPLRR
jgi:sterol 14alpha-demethylase